jgi:hypothetical protein
MLHWKLNKGNCILTDLDHKVELKLFGENSKKEIKKEPFTRILLRKFGIEINDKNLERLIYAVLYVSIIISVIKLR